MTIITYRDDVMAADTKLTMGGGLNWTNVNKIRKVKGYIIGAAGAWDASEHFMQHFDPEIHIKQMKIPMPPAGKEDAFGAIMVSPKGKVYYTEMYGVIGVLKTHGFIALGSGEAVAMAAMEMGATAIEAVKIAIKYDAYCGGGVQKIKL